VSQLENKIETDSRTLTLPKLTWKKLDDMAEKYNRVNAQELIRQCIDAMIKGEEKSD
jgi:hypothetical protein